MKTFINLMKDQSGAAAAEYALILAIVGTLAAIWNAWSVARSPGKHKIGTIWATLIALAAAFLVWLCLDMGLLTTSLNF